MNEEIVLKMAERNLKNDTLTYELFDRIYGMLSRKEQYQVCEILNQNNIELVDSFEGEDITITTEPLQGEESADETVSVDNSDTYLDENVFKDPKGSNEYVIYYKDVKQSNDTLIRLIQQGNKQARQDICIKNEGLVRKYANAYYHNFGNDLDYDDLMQAGFIGVLTAADNFDFSKESAFSTYAIYWIKQAISRQIYDEGYRIRIPVHMMEKISKVTRLDNKYGAEGLNFQQRIRRIAEETGLTEDEVEISFEVKYQFLGGVSLDTPVGEDEETSLGELIPADESYDIENEVIHKALAASLDEILSQITSREEKILRLRFGLDNGHPRTLEEIGTELNLTRERIRQIEERALRKLRHPTRTKLIRDYLYEIGDDK